MPRTGLAPAEIKSKAVEAAMTLMRQEGFDKVRLTDIARQLGVSHAALYLHFEDKRDLVFQVCEETFSKLVAELASLESDVKDPVARLREGMRRYVAFGLRHPQHYLATFVAVPHDQLPEDVARYNNPESNGMKALGVLRATIQACVDAGKFRSVDPDVATRSTWCAMHGVTALLIQMPNFAWGDQKAVIESLIDTTIEGLKLRRR